MKDSLGKLESDIYNLIEKWEEENHEALIENIYLERIDVTGHGREPDSLFKVKCRAVVR